MNKEWNFYEKKREHIWWYRTIEEFFVFFEDDWSCIIYRCRSDSNCTIDPPFETKYSSKSSVTHYLLWVMYQHRHDNKDIHLVSLHHGKHDNNYVERPWELWLSLINTPANSNIFHIFMTDSSHFGWLNTIIFFIVNRWISFSSTDVSGDEFLPLSGFVFQLCDSNKHEFLRNSHQIWKFCTKFVQIKQWTCTVRSFIKVAEKSLSWLHAPHFLILVLLFSFFSIF